MKSENIFAIANEVSISLTKEDGSVEEHKSTNITCNAGRGSIAELIAGNYTTDLGKAKFIGIGTGTNPASISDYALQAEQYRQPIIETFTEVVGTQVKVYARFPAGIALTVTEAGLFTGLSATVTNSSGLLLARTVFSTGIVKASTDAMTIEWTINVNNGTV